MDRQERLFLREGDVALARQLQTGEQGARPGGASAQARAGTAIGVGIARPLERCAIRLGREQRQDALRAFRVL